MNTYIRIVVVSGAVIFFGMGSLVAFGQNMDPSSWYSAYIAPVKPKPAVTSQTVLTRQYQFLTPQYSTPIGCSIGYVYDSQSKTCTRTVKVPTTDNALAACQFKFNECVYENARIQAEILTNCATLKPGLTWQKIQNGYSAQCQKEYTDCAAAESSLTPSNPNAGKSQAEIDADNKAFMDLMNKPSKPKVYDDSLPPLR